MALGFPRLRNVSHRVAFMETSQGEDGQSRSSERCVFPGLHFDKGALKAVMELLKKGKDKIPTSVALPPGCVCVMPTKSDHDNYISRTVTCTASDRKIEVNYDFLGFGYQKVSDALKKGVFPLFWRIAISDAVVRACVYRRDSSRQNSDTDAWFELLNKHNPGFSEEVVLGELREPLMSYVSDEFVAAYRKLLTPTKRHSEAYDSRVGLRSHVLEARKALANLLIL